MWQPAVTSGSLVRPARRVPGRWCSGRVPALHPGGGPLPEDLRARLRCAPCGASHALLSAFTLAGRLDTAETVGVAVTQVAGGTLARWRGATVLSTTRQADRLARLKEHGVDHPLLDTGEIAPAVRELYPNGVDAALDLVGTPTLPDTLRAVRVHGTACFSGSLSNQWTVRDFSPNEYLPKGVRLAGYSGDAADLPREAFQEILDAVAAGRLAFPVNRIYDGLEHVPQAHDDMEHDRATGKLVVRVRH